MPNVVQWRVHLGRKLFLILTFCKLNWLEEEAIYSLAIYNHGYTGIHGWEGGISNKECLTIVGPDDYFTTICCVVEQISILCHSESLTTAWIPQMVSLLLYCPTFPEFLHLQGHYRLLTLSHLSYYAIILHPALAVLFATFCHNIMVLSCSLLVSVCSLFVCFTGEKGGTQSPFVHTLSEERQCQSIQGSGNMLLGMLQAEGEVEHSS